MEERGGGGWKYLKRNVWLDVEEEEEEEEEEETLMYTSTVLSPKKK